MDNRVKEISAADAERARKFRIGDAVTVVQTDAKPWTHDWPRTEAVVWGIAVDRYGKINVTILHDGDVVADGFEPEDLLAIRASDTGRAEAEAKEPAEGVRPPGETLWLAHGAVFGSASGEWDDLALIDKLRWASVEDSAVRNLMAQSNAPALSQPAKGEDDADR